MTESPVPARSGRRIDPWIVAGAMFFVAAVLAAAYPALHAGPATLGGLLLLLGLAGVAFIGLFAFRHQAAPATEPDAGDLLEALDEPAALCGPEGRLLQANSAWIKLIGKGRSLPRAGAAGLYPALKSAVRGESAEAVIPTPGGERAVRVAPLGDRRFLVQLRAAAREPVVIHHVAEPAPRIEAPAPALGGASGLDARAAAAPFGAALLDGQDPFAAVIVECNAALQAITQGRAKDGVRFGELVEENSRAEAAERLKAGQGHVEVKLVGEPVRIAHLYLSAVDGHQLAYLIDVSEQKQLELQLAQSQKMQAIGQLAGGVAHDFNNLLTAIQLRLDELLHRHPVGDPSYEGLNEIRQTSVRAADLVRKLLAFSRKQTVQRETLELGELISEFEVLLRRLLREDVKLECDYGRNLPLVRADKSQLETAVMNLAVNARDAMRGHGKDGHGKDRAGVVRIRTARLTQAEAVALGYTTAAPGEYALVEVADTGPGMSAEIQAKIFEPFFTTKPVGEGTGLGLATVYGIVKQADGWIHVDSEPGRGAAFRIFLPVYYPPASAAPVIAAPKAKPAARDLSGAGRILFVEDEDAVRGVAARLLRARGYEVIEASDGEEALILAEEHAGKIDLLISDVIMPGLDGPSLLKKARQYLGSAPVMFISGYAEAEFSDLLEDEVGVTFLAKPIDIKTLAERVKQQLAA
jgi:two-component system, cell cycle sensor histidine kinase and response regulator CckA